MRTLGEYLMEDGVLTHAQVQRALAHQHELHSRGERKRIGEVLLELGLVTEPQLQRALDRQQLERT
jgi:hypothetical protein